VSTTTDARVGWFARGIHGLHWLEDASLAFLLGSLITLACLQILLRNFFDTGLVWIGPLLRYGVLWVGLLGALAATRSREHIAIDALGRILPSPFGTLARSLAALFACGICGLIAYHAARLVALDRDAETMAFAEVPAWILECIIPLAFGGMSLRFALQSIAGFHDAMTSTPDTCDLSHEI